jgi:ADP-L-glycero-D-manno-heptose 6-epimerase
MDRNAVIIVTGAAGFIGSCLTGYLNRKGYHNIIIVDDFNDDNKKHNYDEKKICARVDKDELFDWLSRYKIRIDFIFHMGVPVEINDLTGKPDTDYSQKLWNYCFAKKIPFVYASSAAANDTGQPRLALFDQWAQQQQNQPPFWAGLNFFDVYGPNEYHKGASASAILTSFFEAQANGKICLAKTDNSRFDFVYIKDVVDICYWFMQRSVEEYNKPSSGLYNIGTGHARSLHDVAKVIFSNIEKEPAIEFADKAVTGKPASVGKEADISRLREAGYTKAFYSLEEGVTTYVRHFLSERKYY